MVRYRSTPRHSFYSRFTAHDSRSSSAYAQQRPQPQSPHMFTSRFSGYPGVGGLPPFSTISVHSLLKPTAASSRPDPSGTRHRPLIYPACPVYPELRRAPRRAPIPFGTLHLRAVLARRIRTYEKCAGNLFRIRTSKTHDLKSFRIRTYKKRPGEGGLIVNQISDEEICPDERSEEAPLLKSDEGFLSRTTIGSEGPPRSPYEGLLSRGDLRQR
jgi:hypothetical protein